MENKAQDKMKQIRDRFPLKQSLELVIAQLNESCVTDPCLAVEDKKTMGKDETFTDFEVLMANESPLCCATQHLLHIRPLARSSDLTSN
jgi:hypothetical protein